MFTEPLAGWRKVTVRETKTRLDWATEVKSLLDEDYPDAELVVLVCDNLNTHTLGALYEAFQPDEATAKRTAKRDTGKEGHPNFRDGKEDGKEGDGKEGHPNFRSDGKEGHPNFRADGKEGHPDFRDTQTSA